MIHQGLRLNLDHSGLSDAASQHVGYLYGEAASPHLRSRKPEGAPVTLCEKASPCPCVSPCQAGQHIARRTYPGNPAQPHRARWLEPL
jgi:hypothetical protein